jgi:hypothetical protein
MQGFALLYKALSAQAVIDGLCILAAGGHPPEGLSKPEA